MKYIGTSMSNMNDSIPNIIDNAWELLKYETGNTNNVENKEIEGYDGYEDRDFDANFRRYDLEG